LNRRIILPAASAALTIALLVLPASRLVGEEKDLGTGYQLENVEVMDPSMRLEDARRYMILFNEALGVQCRDCHDLRDFASDDKELKLVAREMMKLELEINEEWFPDHEENVVTCWTCHQGQRIPAATSGFSGSLLPDAEDEGTDP
jgi:photosynthetic reaction center cytochrome c subunit